MNTFAQFCWRLGLRHFERGGNGKIVLNIPADVWPDFVMTVAEDSGWEVLPDPKAIYRVCDIEFQCERPPIFHHPV